jgi:hypothetical protein
MRGRGGASIDGVVGHPYTVTDKRWIINLIHLL